MVTNRKVHGAHKLWKAARRAGHDIGRDRVARLMRAGGMIGVSRRRRKIVTTRPDPDAVRAPDLVKRARPSIGTVADSLDNALAETTNGLYKTECVYGPDAPRPWADVDELELATLAWVHWFNHQRLHGHCGDIPPVEFEAAFCAAHQAAPTGVGNQEPEPPPDPGRFSAACTGAPADLWRITRPP